MRALLLFTAASTSSQSLHNLLPQFTFLCFCRYFKVIDTPLATHLSLLHSSSNRLPQEWTACTMLPWLTF